MMPARFQTIEEIFHAALEREPGQVSAFLDAACEGDGVLRDKVGVLLASHLRSGNFIEVPAARMATRIIESGQADLIVGQTIGHYKISKRIGTGGMGEVYLATDLTAGRKAALKLLPLRFTGDAERLKRFQQEARAVVGLNHPNILTVYEIGEDRSTHYIASELIEGETLRQRLVRGRMELTEAVDVAIQVATALAAAHEAGIVHRDIKPENIMLRPDGYVKVLDFGIAKLAEQEGPVTIPKDEALVPVETNLGSILGTVRYMSPEQARGAPVDQRTDVWSLGVVVYEMLTGHAPFTGGTPKEVMSSILEMEPPPLTSHIAKTPARLHQIVHKALNKEPQERYQSVRELQEALGSLRRAIEFKAELKRSSTIPTWLRWARSPVALALLFLAATFALALPFYWHRNLTINSIPEKSIAVLPFENLSDNKDNSDFGAGIQDDVLTSLAQIHELKVISRTSVMAYQKPGGRNMREISRALGVANVLEGSVRRTGNRVLVNVQLIDARNDRHLWAERYDRSVADSIGLQGELATQIAAALKATLAPEEKARLDVGPTTNSEAYVLYLTALGKEATDWEAAEQLHVQAAAIDPKFAMAYAHASILNSWFFPERHAKARAQAEEALRLSPKLGESHVALGLCLYVAEKKYDAALKEFEIAAAISPNNADIYKYVGGIYRRQGRWRDAVANFDRAISLDPLNPDIIQFAANNYVILRDWAAAAAGCTRTLEIKPESMGARITLAYLEVFRNGNPAAGAKLLQNIPPGRDPYTRAALTRWDLAMLERDYAAAEKLSSDLPELPPANIGYPKSFYQARTALARGDMEAARRYFAATTPVLEARVRDQPDDANDHSWLGILYGYMRRKEDAIRESRRAVELEPESRDAFHGAQCSASLALVYALVGEEDAAITLIERLLSTPGALSYPDYPQNMTLADLRLRWEWDSLRSNPRFQKIIAGPEPKTLLRRVTTNPPPEKSIAVLPFSNLSADQENRFFAEGMQDDILTALAKIADLKVIARTSVLSYPAGPTRDLREIGQMLGVSNILEGSVRRFGGKVRVTTQLIDTHSNTHIWAETYDRDLTDVFAIQSEIAQAIADQLKAKISPGEKARLDTKPTENAEAYLLYLRGRELETRFRAASDQFEAGIKFYEQARDLDPAFALARARLSILISHHYQGFDPARRAQAEAEAQEALRLRPDLGEARLALAYTYFRGRHEYDRALTELERAGEMLPNSAEVPLMAAYIYKWQNKLRERIAALRRAETLDPRDPAVLRLLGMTLRWIRDWPEVTRTYDRLRAVQPNDPGYQFESYRAQDEFRRTGDIEMLKRANAIDVKADPALDPNRLNSWLYQTAVLERDYAAAERYLTQTPTELFDNDASAHPKIVHEALLAVARGTDPAGTERALDSARQEIETWLAPVPNLLSGQTLDMRANLALVHALLGRKEDAIREARYAIDIETGVVEKNYASAVLALVYARTGEPEEAITLIERLLTAPVMLGRGAVFNITLTDLKWHWVWDPLRSNPRFQKIIAGPEPKTLLTAP